MRLQNLVPIISGNIHTLHEVPCGLYIIYCMYINIFLVEAEVRLDVCVRVREVVFVFVCVF